MKQLIVSLAILLSVSLAQAQSPLFVKQIDSPVSTDSNAAYHWPWLVDYNGDQALDIMATIRQIYTPFNQSLLANFQNQCIGAGTFTRVQVPGLHTNDLLKPIGWSDVDNDGDLDFLAHLDLQNYNGSTRDTVYLFKNDGSAGFSKNTVTTIVPTSFIVNQHQLRGGNIADFNNDGNVDFFLCGALKSGTTPSFFLYAGDGQGGFSPQTNGTSIYNTSFHCNRTAVADLDLDGNMDIVVVGGGNEKHVFYGDGSFGFDEDVSFNAVYPAGSGHGHGLVIGDYNNDGLFDIFFHLSNVNQPSLLLTNNGNRSFTNTVIPALTQVSQWSHPNSCPAIGDVDNDGDIDFFLPSLSNHNTLLLNDGNSGFQEAVNEPTNDPSDGNINSSSASFGDLDNDGDLDLYVNNIMPANAGNFLFVNQTEVNNPTNSWLTLELEGDTSSTSGNMKKTPASAEGTRVVARLTNPTASNGAPLEQLRYVHANNGAPHELHFGFNQYGDAIELEIFWPSGLIEIIVVSDLKKKLKVVEGSGIATELADCLPLQLPNDSIIGNVVMVDPSSCEVEVNNAVAYAPPQNRWIKATQHVSGQPTGASYHTFSLPTDGSYKIHVPSTPDTFTIKTLPDSTFTYVLLDSACIDGSSGTYQLEYLDIIPQQPIHRDTFIYRDNFDGCDYTVFAVPLYPQDHIAPCPNVEMCYEFRVTQWGWDPLSGSSFNVTIPGNSIINTVSYDSCFSSHSLSSQNGNTLVSFSLDSSQLQQCTATICVTPKDSLNSQLLTSYSLEGSCVEEISAPNTSNLEYDTIPFGLNEGTLTEIVTCAYDPNDNTLLLPTACGPQGNIPMNEPLVYRVRFQNLGNYHATNVLVSNELDTDLDITTLQVLSSSHPITGIQVNPNNHVLFSFDDIMLPAEQDSGSASNGYVIFKVQALPNTPEGTVIENVASIYFDLNDAVVTNLTTHTLLNIPSPDVVFTSQHTCTSFQNSQDFSYTGDTPDSAQYSWDFGPDATPQFASGPNPDSIVFSTPGPKTVTLTVERLGCVASRSEVVEVTAPVRCGRRGRKIEVCLPNGKIICVSPRAALKLVSQADACIGACPQ